MSTYVCMYVYSGLTTRPHIHTASQGPGGHGGGSVCGASGTVTSKISKFGVGAIHAGFFVGKAIKVVTSTQVRFACFFCSFGRPGRCGTERTVSPLFHACTHARTCSLALITCYKKNYKKQDSPDVRCFTMDEDELQKRSAQGNRDALYQDDVRVGDKCVVLQLFL